MSSYLHLGIDQIFNNQESRFNRDIQATKNMRGALGSSLSPTLAAAQFLIRNTYRDADKISKGDAQIVWPTWYNVDKTQTPLCNEVRTTATKMIENLSTLQTYFNHNPAAPTLIKPRVTALKLLIEKADEKDTKEPLTKDAQMQTDEPPAAPAPAPAKQTVESPLPKASKPTEEPKKSNFPWYAVAAAAVTGFAVGAWVFSRNK